MGVAKGMPSGFLSAESAECRPGRDNKSVHPLSDGSSEGVGSPADTLRSLSTPCQSARFNPVRRTRMKWTEEETQALLEGLRRHGRDFSAICNDGSLAINSCRRITDARERFRVLYRNGQLPEDLRELATRPLTQARRGARKVLDWIEAPGECAGTIVAIRKGTFDEPVIKVFQDGEVSEWISTTHFPRSLVRVMLLEFIERTSGQLKVAMDLADGLEKRPEEPMGDQVSGDTVTEPFSDDRGPTPDIPIDIVEVEDIPLPIQPEHAEQELEGLIIERRRSIMAQI